MSGRLPGTACGGAAGLLGATVLALLVAAGHAPAAEAPAAALAAWVAGLDAAALRDRGTVEARLGARLSARDANASFSFWTADAAAVPGLAVTAVDYRRPRRGGGATAGPLLALDVAADPCLARAALTRAMPELRFSDMTPHDVPQARAYWSRRTDGVRASFGFPVRGPDCLRSVVLAVERP